MLTALLLYLTPSALVAAIGCLRVRRRLKASEDATHQPVEADRVLVLHATKV